MRRDGTTRRSLTDLASGSGRKGERLVWYGLILLGLAAFVLLQVRLLRPVYLINDDWSMYSIMSGAYSGTPEAHIMYMPYPLSWLMTELYRAFPGVQWYGVILYGSQLVCLLLILQRVLRYCTSRAGKALGCVTAGCLFVLIDLWSMSVVQFTLISAGCAGTAIFLFLTSDAGGQGIRGFLKDNIPTFIAFCLALCIRMEVMAMMMPIAGMIWLGKWLAEREPAGGRRKQRTAEEAARQRSRARERAGCFFGFAGVLAFLALVLLGIHAGTYAVQPWRDTMTADFRRSQLWDYHGWPEYADYADRLEALGIDEESYGYLQNNIPFVGYGLDVEDWNALAQLSTEAYNDGYTLPMKLAHGLSVSWQSLLDPEMRPLNTMMAAFYVLTLLLILARRRWKALYVYAALLAGRMCAWLYLLLEGRFPSRLPQSFFVAESIVLLGIVLRFGLLRWEGFQERKGPERRRIGIIWGAGLLLLLAAALHNVYTVRDQVEAVRLNEADWQGLKDYCASHPDQLYLWYGGSDTLNRYCDSVFDAGENRYQNFLFTGSVYCIHPVTLEKMEQYGITDMSRLPEAVVSREDIRFIFAEGRLQEDSPVVTFYRRLYPELKVVKTDSFSTPQVQYEVFQFRK